MLKLNSDVYAKVWMTIFRNELSKIESEAEVPLSVGHHRKMSNTYGCMTRSGYEKHCAKNPPEMETKGFEVANPAHPPFGAVVSNFGGYTKATVTLPNGEFEGKCNFGKNQFSKNYGAMIAIKRALHSNAEGRSLLDTVNRIVKERVAAAEKAVLETGALVL